MTAAAPPIEAAREEPKKRGFRLPSAYTILFILIVIVAGADVGHPRRPLRLQRRRDADPGHLPPGRPEPGQDPPRLAHRADQRPVRHRVGRRRHDQRTTTRATLFGAIDVALFILVIGGFLGVTMKTGAIQAGIARVVERLRGRERLLIPILMVVFAVGGTSYGMAEESLAFYALVITVMIAAGYDSLTGAALIMLGCGIGTSSARRSTRSRPASRRGSPGRASTRAWSAGS